MRSNQHIQDLVDDVRRRFFRDANNNLEEYSSEGLHLYFNQPQYKLIEAYLERKKYDVDRALRMIKNTLKFFKDGNHYITSGHRFPKFFYECGALSFLGFDKSGNAILYLRPSHIFGVPKILHDAFQKFLIFISIKTACLGKVNNGGWTVVVDMAGFSMWQVDLSIVYHQIALYRNYVPAGINSILVCNVKPWVRRLIKAYLMIVPGSLRPLIEIMEEGQIHRNVDDDNLPICLGGCGNLQRLVPPEECPDFETFFMKEYGLSEKEASQLFADYRKFIGLEE